eukprot:CAMPEP_0181253790 /NCGR_PEP_ID=MMETSP1096-20121128/48228_1 /TAXON_ID=156174 ORGANISM="Chrysochromulina ericina, Strain CCMP281" /NCGR_SAMPLE_ID=MMETSP1096 /ASSEMBLY_ACC=CAM_ASM_000453 /LENGTH=30 /DNA_ID= /DNA_START= /DNA_END= /DNA_ORIENTATION=
MTGAQNAYRVASTPACTIMRAATSLSLLKV